MLNIQNPITTTYYQTNNSCQPQIKEEEEEEEELSLVQSYFSNKQQFKREFHSQMEEILELIFYEYDGGEWRNEFGTMSSYFFEEEKHDNYLENGYHVRFFTEPLSDIIFFKILPKYPTAFIEDFLSNINQTGKYDGFVCSKNKHIICNILPNYKPIKNTFCVSNQAIEKYNHKNIIYLVNPSTYNQNNL
jgi:hypothetical protein